MRFVLDASVALSWLLEDAGAGQAYAASVFDVLGDPDAEAQVPVTWALELANVIAKSEERGHLLAGRSYACLSSSRWPHNPAQMEKPNDQDSVRRPEA